MPADDIVAAAAAPRPLPVRIKAADGSTETVLEEQQPDLTALRGRIGQILHREGDTLRAGNLLLRAHLLSRKAQDQLARERDERAKDVIEKFQWITAGTVFANPFPALELVANGAVQFQMISELAGVYGVQISTSHVRMIGGQMIQMLLKLGLVETATSLIAGIFKSTLVGYAAAGGVQAVSMAYLTHVSGEAFAEYFRGGQTWGDGGMQAALIRQFDLTSRAEFLQEFAKQAVQKVSARLLHGTGQDSRTAGDQEVNESLHDKYPCRNHPATTRGFSRRPIRRSPGSARPCARAKPHASRSWNGCLAQVDEWEPKVHAWVVLDRERAIEQARGLDDELKDGNDRGPLHGIPIGIKDIIDVAGLPTACGSKRWAEQVAESRRRRRRQSPRGRRGDHGQDGHDALCLDRSADHPQPLEPRADAGGLVERLGRGGGLRHVLRCDRDADRRLDHAAGVVLRRGGDEADPMISRRYDDRASCRLPAASTTSVRSRARSTTCDSCSAR